MLDPLDNVSWHSLTGRQRSVARVTEGLAARYEPDICVFSALPDLPTPPAWDALATLLEPGEPAVLFRDHVAVPDGWEELFGGEGVQMICDGPVAPSSSIDIGGLSSGPLAADAVAEMLDLVARTEPGPFSARTIELGAYIGLRDAGRLVAMAGQRGRTDSHVEISAVCTDPAYRGRGLAAFLVLRQVELIRASGDVPFLHVAASNSTARRLYEALGFTTRRTVQYVGVRPTA